MPSTRSKLPRTTTQRALFLIACLNVAIGAVVIGWAIREAVGHGFGASRVMLLVLLTLAAACCSRFPLRLGTNDVFVSLDSIPLVLAVALLRTPDAVLVGSVATVAAVVGQPPLEPGWRAWLWRPHMVVATGIAMGFASYVADNLFGIGGIGVVLVAPAFAIALVLEVLFDLFVVVEIEATSPGGSRHLLDSLVVPAANVFLPAVCVAILTPYVVDDPWQFAVLLPILLVGMYGALWVANSQQREKRRGDRLKDTFSRYVPEGIVDDNIESIQEIELGGEQHEVSVLFCDIRGFTSWSEDKGATEVITELNVLLTELSASVMGTGGTLDKFTGDGLMAFWGAPVPVEDHADRASRAALDMLVRLDAVNDRRSEDGQAPFAIGVAVHSGTAVVGNVGHERRLDYTAIGDTVNTTARLEASTKDLGAVLLVSRATVDQLGDELRERAMRIGDVMMKGKARPVEAWALQPLRPELDGVDDEFAA
jgi:class 3 adenylate cyclase